MCNSKWTKLCFNLSSKWNVLLNLTLKLENYWKNYKMNASKICKMLIASSTNITSQILRLKLTPSQIILKNPSWKHLKSQVLRLMKCSHKPHLISTKFSRKTKLHSIQMDFKTKMSIERLLGLGLVRLFQLILLQKLMNGLKMTPKTFNKALINQVLIETQAFKLS